jgi:hypothetical protein
MLKIFVVFLLILSNWKRMPIYTTLPCRYLSTFSKIKMRFHPLAYICTIKILFLIFEVQVVNIWPCHNNLENNYVFSWGQTRAFMFFLFPLFPSLLLKLKTIGHFLMLAKNLHVWEDLCWMLKILQLQYHQPHVLTVPIMSISLKRVFIVIPTIINPVASKLIVQTDGGWPWPDLGVIFQDWNGYIIEFVWFNLDMGATLSSNSRIWWADIQMGLAFFGPNCKPLDPREKMMSLKLLRNQSIGYSAVITKPIIKLYTLTTLHKCQALVLWWRPKPTGFPMCAYPQIRSCSLLVELRGKGICSIHIYGTTWVYCLFWYGYHWSTYHLG